MIDYRTRIQRYLRALCLEGTYFVVSYHDGIPELIVEGTTERIKPTTILVNETGKGFQADVDMGRKQILKPSRWTFQVRMTFAQEVSTENYEQFLMESIPRIPPEGEHKSVTLRIQSATYDHPPQQNPSNGSAIVFEFDAEVGRS